MAADPQDQQSGARLRLALFLSVGMAMTGLALIGYGIHLFVPDSAWDVFGDTELRSIDVRFSVRGEHPRPKDIVVVKIDDRTFYELDQRWPFARSLYARVTRNLKKDGAKVIAYDIQVSEQTPGDEGALQDNLFLRANRAAGNAVFSTTEVGKKGQPNFLGEQPGIRFARVRVGNGNFDSDRGGVDRRLPYEIDGLKSFSVVAVERATGKTVGPFSSDTNLIDFVGPVGTMPSISFSRVYLEKFQQGFFRGKIAVIGAWAPSLQDIHPVSFGQDEMPGPEI